MYLSDPKTKQPSVTMTMFVVGFVAATLKLLTSGIVVGSIALGSFSGGDFAAVVGSLGAVYTMRKHSDRGAA